jgi:two-component system, OmpR family, response regulator
VPPLALVVDDDPGVLEITCRYLQDAAFECLPAGSGNELMALLDAGRIPDLLVLDIRLPDVPGPELALRIHTHYPRIPVLFISAWPASDTDPAELDVLRWEFVQKPFTGQTLIQAARELVTREVV